jgi:glycosyltransferase involved in cell wall biosynthesis
MKEPVLVSIAIPTFNRLDYLKEAVASALAQTYERVEVLIGDDGREEAIRAWGEEIARRDARVRYRRNPYNLGLAGNWNALADAARGEFLVIIGDDDRLLPEFVETLIDVIQSTAAQVAFSNHYLIDDQGSRLEALSRQCTERYRRDQLPAGEVRDAALCVWQNSVPMSAALMRRREIQRLRFKEDLNTPEIELFARLAQESGRFAFTPAYLSEYRTHTRSATTKGLQSERLVKYLAAIPVSRAVEPYKRELMSGLLVDAVSRCLQQNERDLARQFLRHEYYPQTLLSRTKRQNGDAGLTFTGYAQQLCASLPAPLGCRAYRLMQRIKRAR